MGCSPSRDAPISTKSSSQAKAQVQPLSNESIEQVPLGVMTDSYKATHNVMYPEAKKMVAYGEFRTGFDKDDEDTRILFYGIRYIIETKLNKQWTMDDVNRAAEFYGTHMAPSYTNYPFPKHLFEKFVLENNGYFPVTIEALPEGTAIHSHIPVYQITASGEYSSLCTFLETLLTMIWYPTTVATLSRRSRDVIEHSFDKTADLGRNSLLLESRLHDFGFRGCTSVEQSIIGGCAHLLNFKGTDTMSAAYYAQFVLNQGRPVGQSVPATEHSVMTSWPTEKAAIENMIEHFGTGIFAIVMDSYDYAHALSEVLPSIATQKVEKGGFLVLRPDSGDPVETVLMALKAADKVFGSTVNEHGFKLVKGCGVIQGDGISINTIKKIAQAVEAAGFSAENVAYGMGGGLLQKVNRDTLAFATKLSAIVYKDGTSRDVMKRPKTDSSKFSLPGALAVKRVNGVPTVFPKDSLEVLPSDNLLRVVYDQGPLKIKPWDDFDTVRQRAAVEWHQLPLVADNISESLKIKMKNIQEAV